MDLKCRHTDWEACPKCIDYQEENIKKQRSSTLNHNENEILYKEIHSMYDGQVKVCKTPKSKRSTVCPQCNKQFSKVSNLNRHVATVHSILRKFVCRNCSKSYYDAEKLDKHLQRCNYNIQLLKKTPGERIACNDAKIFTSNGEDNGICHDNEEDLDSGDDLPSMVVGENGLHDNEQDSESNDKEIVDNDVKPLQICNSLFSTKHVTKFRHQINSDSKMLKKRKRKSTVCPHCHKQFSRVSNLNRHVRTVHGVKKFCCKECNKSYASIEKLNEHYSMMHSFPNSFNQNVVTNGSDGISGINNVSPHRTSVLETKDFNKVFQKKEIIDEENTVVILDNYDMENEDFSRVSKNDDCNSEINHDSLTNGGELDNEAVKQENDNNIMKKENDFDKTRDGETEGSSHSRSEHEELQSSRVDDEIISKKNTISSESHMFKSMNRSKCVVCPHCEKQFSKVSNLNRHIFDVHNIRYICEICSKSFAQPEKLEKHILTSCNPDRNYKLLKADTALPCMVIEEIFH